MLLYPSPYPLSKGLNRFTSGLYNVELLQEQVKDTDVPAPGKAWWSLPTPPPATALLPSLCRPSSTAFPLTGPPTTYGISSSTSLSWGPRKVTCHEMKAFPCSAWWKSDRGHVVIRGLLLALLEDRHKQSSPFL